MQGLFEEGESILAETEDGTMARDAAIIMSAHKFEHYETATYGGASYYFVGWRFFR